MSSRFADFETLRYEERGSVAWVTLDRPDALNAFTATMQDEFRTVWQGLRTNDDVRAVVLTGAGDKAFCAGIDRNDVAWRLGDEHDTIDNQSQHP